MWLAFHLLIGAVLAVLVELTCRVLRPRPSVCHLLWLAVLVKLMMPPLVSWPWALPGSGGLERFAVLEFGTAPAEEPAATPNGRELGRAAASSTSPAPPQPFAIDLLSTGIGLWIFGAVCTAALQMLRLHKLSGISRRSTPAPDWLEAMAAEMAQRLEVRPPRVLLAEGLCSAVAFNTWRPRVLVSRELIDAIPREDFAGILAHELAHFKRRDLWIGFLEFAAQCAWWWNPLLYVVRRRLHLYREMAADAWVLWALPDGRRHYAEMLVRVVDIASRQPAPMAAFGMAGGSAATFERRLAMVLEAASPCRLPRVTLAATLLLLVLIAPGWSTARPETAPPGTVIDEVPGSGTPCGEPAMVAELQAWFFTSNKVTFESLEMAWLRTDDDSENAPVQLQASDIGAADSNTGATFMGIITGAVKVGVGGKTLTTQGNELRWGENGKPAEEDATQIFSATVGLMPDQNTLIKVHKPEQAEPFQAPGQLELSLRPQQDKLRAWIRPPQAGDTSAGSPMYQNVLLPTRQNQWLAAMISVPIPKGKGPGVFILFYKVQTATPDLLEQVETGDTDDCRITHSAAEPFTGIYATAAFKIIEVAQTEYEKVAAALAPLKSETTSAGATIHHLRDADTVINLLRNDVSKAELLSACWVTFAVATPPRSVKVVQRQGGPFINLLEASEALAEFWEEARPTAVIADLRTETFVDRSKNKVQMHEGLIAAIAAKQDEGADTIGARVLVEDLRLDRHKRGLAFWKPRRLPDVLSNPVEVNFTCSLGDSVVFEAPTPKPDKHRLILLTIDKPAAGIYIGPNSD